MKSLRLLTGAAALVACTAFATTHVVSARQDRAAPPADAGMMDPAMMARMAELAAPGAAHAELAKLAGTWEDSYVVSMPGMPSMETKGTRTTKSLLGGRYILEEIEFSMMGMKMEGVSLMGYDNMKKEYVSVWMDSMSTWPIFSRGPKNASGDIETKGTMVDVAGERPFRMVWRQKGANEVEAEMYDTIPPTGEVKVMTIKSTRKQ